MCTSKEIFKFQIEKSNAEFFSRRGTPKEKKDCITCTCYFYIYFYFQAKKIIFKVFSLLFISYAITDTLYLIHYIITQKVRIE